MWKFKCERNVVVLNLNVIKCGIIEFKFKWIKCGTSEFVWYLPLLNLNLSELNVVPVNLWIEWLKWICVVPIQIEFKFKWIKCGTNEFVNQMN